MARQRRPAQGLFPWRLFDQVLITATQIVFLRRLQTFLAPFWPELMFLAPALRAHLRCVSSNYAEFDCLELEAAHSALDTLLASNSSWQLVVIKLIGTASAGAWRSFSANGCNTIKFDRKDKSEISLLHWAWLPAPGGPWAKAGKGNQSGPACGSPGVNHHHPWHAIPR